MASSFNYSIANDTLQGVVNEGLLKVEIQKSTITIALDDIGSSGDTLNILFKTDISSAEETELNGLVAAHNGFLKVEEISKVQLFDDETTPAAFVVDGSVRRIPVDIKGDATLVGPQGPEGPQGPQGPAGPAGIFGSEFQFAESLGSSSTTSGVYQQKLRLTTTDLPNATYFLQWSFFLESTDRDNNARIQLNDSTTIKEYNIDINGDGDADASNSISGFTIQTLSGVNNIDVDWNDAGGGTSTIRDVRLVLWRVI